MKTRLWFSRNGVLSHLRIAATVVLIFAAAMALVAAFVPTAGVAEAQISPKPMPFPPIPPKKDARALAATPALAPSSPWQLLTNQPPVLDYTIAALATRFYSPMALLCCKMTAAKIGGN